MAGTYLLALNTGSSPSDQDFLFKATPQSPNQMADISFSLSFALLIVTWFISVITIFLQISNFVIGFSKPKEEWTSPPRAGFLSPFSFLYYFPGTCAPRHSCQEAPLWFHMVFGTGYCRIFTNCQHSIHDIEKTCPELGICPPVYNLLLLWISEAQDLTNSKGKFYVSERGHPRITLFSLSFFKRILHPIVQWL